MSDDDLATRGLLYKIYRLHKGNTPLSNAMTWSKEADINALLEDFSNSLANALELPHSCAKPSLYAGKPKS